MPDTESILHFDLAAVPFSRYGAYLAFAQLPARDGRAAGIYLRTLHGAVPQREICRCELLTADGNTTAAVVAVTPSCLRLSAAAGRVEICFDTPRSLRMRGEGLGLRLVFAPQLYDVALPRGSQWQLNLFSCRLNLALTTAAGALCVDAPRGEDGAEHLSVECQPDRSGFFEIGLREFQSAWPREHYLLQRDLRLQRDFRSCERAVAAEFRQWLQDAPAAPPQYAQTRVLAAYIQWSCVVEAHDRLTRPALLMSNNWLHAVWSWDHCFNAMALSCVEPALAWDQFMLPFDAQDRHGALPDCLDDAQAVWNFCKPPIHGWALLWMLRRSTFIGPRQLREIYAPLCRWTRWWLARRDVADGLPQYNHGNDSGWDNSTAFASALPLQSPDLAAFLCVQMECLAELARRLERPRAAQQWQRRADSLLQKLLARCWRGDRFIALPTVADATPADASAAGDSLLLFLPIVLGKKLPADVAAALVAALGDEQRFLAPYGLASEALGSPLYRVDSYWRGPSWAPATLLIVEGLTALGEHALARTIARRFCAAVQLSGCAENFDAVTGRGLRDPAHTWTASVFLILARDYLSAAQTSD